MTMNRRRISSHAAMAAAWLGALAGAVAPRAEAELKVFGNTTTLELAPVLLAAQELGGTVSVGTGGIPDLFDETAADLATNAETQALRQSVDHPDLRLILTVAEGFYRIVARRSAGIAVLSDLRGKRIATSPYTSASYYLHKMLGTVGMSSDDITIVPVQPLNLMPRALANREVDAVVIWEPEIQLAAEAIGNDAIEFQDRRVYRELFSLYSTAATLADPAKRREIVAFVRALLNATARIGERPSDVWPLVAASTGYDVELIERVWHHEGYPGTLVSDLLDVMVEEDVYVARERNRAPRTRAQLATLIDDSVLRDALMPPPSARQAPQTHWDQYKNRPASAQPDQHLTDPALVGAIDLHAHHDPDSYPRNLDAFDVARLAKDRGLRGIVLKNHWTETAGLAYLVRKYATPGFEVFGALTLDLPVGGLNPQAVRYMADVAGRHGRIVWMPTHDSEHEVLYNKESRPFIGVSRDGVLVPEVHDVIAVIAEHDLTLATGHVTAEEALQILRAAKAAGVRRLIVTHPLFAPQYTFMSIEQLRAAADLGAFIEIIARNLARDGEAKDRSLAAIRAIGAEHFFVSSDAGLLGELNHTDALALAAKALRVSGFTEADLTTMYKSNPAFLVNLPALP